MVAHAIEQPILSSSDMHYIDRTSKNKMADVNCLDYSTDSTSCTSSDCSSVCEIDYEEQQFHEALAIARRKLGADHPQVCDIVFGLAAMHRSRCNYEESLSYFGEGLDIIRKHNGESHVSVAGVLVNIANVHRQSGALEEALVSFEEALKVFECVGVSTKDRNVARIMRIMKRVRADIVQK